MTFHCSTHRFVPGWSLARRSLTVYRILDASKKSSIVSPIQIFGDFAFQKNFTLVRNFHQRDRRIQDSFFSSPKRFIHASPSYKQLQNDRKSPEDDPRQADTLSQSGVISRITAQVFPQWRQAKQAATISAQSRPLTPLENISPQSTPTPITVQLQVNSRFTWWERWLQDFKNTWDMIYASRKLILTLGSILFVINRLYLYETDYLWSVFNKNKPTSTVARWLHSFSTVSIPRPPTYAEPSLAYTLLGCVASDWLRTPLNIFTLFSCSFACMDLPNVKDNCLMLFLLVPLLKQVISSNKIFIAYVVGGIIAVNFHCATQYFFNPHANLSIDELQRKLDAVPLLEHQRSHRSKLWNDARDKLSSLAEDVANLKDGEMRKHQSDSQTMVDKDLVKEDKTKIPRIKEADTEVIEEDLGSKAPGEGNPINTEFDADESSDGEPAGNVSDEKKPEEEPIKKKRVELTVTEENLIKIESVDLEETTPEPEKKAPAQEIQEKLEKMEETKKEIASLQETQLLFDYAGVSLGSSCSMTCLSKPTNTQKFPIRPTPKPNPHSIPPNLS